MPASENRPIHAFATGTADNGSLFLVDTPDISATSGYTTEKLPMSDVGTKLITNTQYTQALNTNVKTVSGAINELLGNIGKDIIGTLTAGSTSITLSDNVITTTSTIDVYTDTFGVNPTNVVVATGSVTLTFEAQQSDLGVKVRVS